MHDCLKFQKLCAWWVHRELTDQEKINWMGLSLQHLLEYTEEEALCTKLTNFNRVMNMVTKAIKSIHSVSLKSRFFNALLAGTESEYSDLILHTKVHCLNMS
jgi:hypothetical protein